MTVNSILAQPRIGTKQCAVAALLLIAPIPTLGVWLALYATPGPLGSLLWAIAKAWFLLAPALWFRWVERQNWSWSAPRHGGFTVGTLTGVAMASIILLGYYLFGHGQFDAATMRERLQTAGLTSVEQYLWLAVYWTLCNSLVEEYVFRWFLYRQCEQLMPPTAAVLAAATLFTVHHTVALSAYVPWQQNILASIGVFSASVIWSLLYLRYRSIWPGYVSHIFADLAVFGLGYYLLYRT